MKFLHALIFVSLLTTFARAQNLDIYFIDVEGGGATLIVTPQRESVLIDSGWRRDDNRDANRIMAAARDAGLTRIDNLVTTHYHADHFGSVMSLSGMIPIDRFYDHGPVISLKEEPQFQLLYGNYIRASKGEHQTLRPGDVIPLKSGRVPLKLICVASSRDVLEPPDASKNPECANLEQSKEDPSDNAASVALLLHFGQFDFFDGADLTWNIEASLVCPTNRLGRVDVYQVDHHGFKISNNPVLLRSILPTVAVMPNGPQPKGCDPEVVARLKSLPSLKGLFQLHLNPKTHAENNTEPDLIANLTPESKCQGYWIHLSVDATASSYTITNQRNGRTWTYPVQ